MSSVGYTIFGRPVQHEYESNGLFNEHNLNSESYLSDRIELKKGQSLVILKRFKDNNGVEIITVFLNTYAISYNERPGGFVGAGIAFTGKPTTKLIYERLKQLHQQSLLLLEPESYKFKESKIKATQIKLPVLSEDGLFASRAPRKYSARDYYIGVKFSGSFYESIMSAIQGFSFNESFYGVKTAYISNSGNLLKSLLPAKSIYQLYQILDYSYVYKKHMNLLNERKKKIDEEIKEKKQNFSDNINEIEKRLKLKEKKLEEDCEDLDRREKSIRELEENKNDLQKQIDSKKREINDLSTNKEKLEKTKDNIIRDKRNFEQKIHNLKHRNFQEAINNRDFHDQRLAYEESIKEKYEKEQKSNKKTDWQKRLFALMSVLFLISTIVVSYFAFIKKPEIPKFVNQNIEIPESKNLTNNLNISFPNPLTANEFLDKDKEEQEEHIREINAGVALLSDDAYKAFIDNYEVISNRPWNFREVLTNNIPKDIDKGLERLVRIKKLPSIKDTTLFYKPRFLLNQIDNQGTILDEITIEITSDNKKDILKHYIERDNNIYDKLGIKYIKPEEGMTYQDSDPVLLMHFRWMVFNYNLNSKRNNINKLKVGDKIQVPVLK